MEFDEQLELVQVHGKTFDKGYQHPTFWEKIFNEN